MGRGGIVRCFVHRRGGGQNTSARVSSPSPLNVVTGGHRTKTEVWNLTVMTLKYCLHSRCVRVCVCVGGGGAIYPNQGVFTLISECCNMGSQDGNRSLEFNSDDF